MPGWERTPLKDSLLYGGGDFVWYDDITEAQEEKNIEQIDKRYKEKQRASQT